MGQTAGVSVLKRASGMNTSQQFDGYSGVRIYVGTDDDGNAIVYEAGNTTGRTLEIQNDFGTQQMADDILERIQGYQYQPIDVNKALLDPSAEMGDGVNVNGVYSGIFVRSTTFGRLMAADIAAPTEEEMTHEYAATDSASSDRKFSRFVRSTRSAISLTSTQISAEVARATTAEESLSSRITINSDSITSEVTRATEAESTLSSRITQNADNISATVTEVGKKLDQTRNNSSFGWNLTSTSFSLNANNSQNIFYADRNGIKIRGNAEVTGRVTATSGYIGGSSGFTINATAIYNGKSSLTANSAGVYIGTNGIALGSLSSDNRHSKFQVDSNGSLYAQSGTFAGSVFAKNIQYGGSTYGYFNGSGITSGSITGYDKLAEGTVTGGWGGSLAEYTVDYSNTGFTGTLDQVGTNAANISYLEQQIQEIYYGNFSFVTADHITARNSLYLGGYSMYVDGDNYVRASFDGG